ncbi:hypothetical protein EON65_52180, partial [archaeon]
MRIKNDNKPVAIPTSVAPAPAPSLPSFVPPPPTTAPPPMATVAHPPPPASAIAPSLPPVPHTHSLPTPHQPTIPSTG